MTDQSNPQEALAAIDAARSKVKASLDYHPIWDVVAAIPVVMIVMGQSLDTAYSSLILVFAMVGVILMTKAWKAHFGWWVNGYSPKRARWIAIGGVALILPLMGVSVWFKLRDEPVVWWWPLVAGALAWVIMICMTRLWVHVYRKELEAQGA